MFQCFMGLILSLQCSIPVDSEKGIYFYAPEDGGTPRSSDRIERLSPNEFRILACAEEGKVPLTHAISRLDLVCRNDKTQPEIVTLHIDLSGDSTRANFDDNMYGGMPSRDFVFIQSPGQAWKQIDGQTEGWVCTVKFSAMPGETKLGLSPWYTYGDYLKFVNSLPEHPHLKREVIGLSDKGREHWELTITDPEIPMQNKRCIFLHAREHGYESFSSFAIEGLLSYLLSDDAKEYRKEYIFVIHPMTNVDGVAEGNEYRVGYDFPEPRGTASGRLTFDAMDRLKPDFAVTWHNWIAPRDIDTLFYTDSQDGKPTRRAWDLFTQRFTSPRSACHRWESETKPIQKNWYGRKLSDDNVHQYAMKHYGTQVWGWELPWWRRDTDDAYKAGKDFAIAFLDTLAELKADKQMAVSEIVIKDIPRWEMHEFTLNGKVNTHNPFNQVALIGEFTAPSGREIIFEGFYDGKDTWRLRFAPDEVGEWRFILRGEGVQIFQKGKLYCIPAEGHGFIHTHPENPYSFAYDDGTPFFPMGDTCYGLYADSHITSELRSLYLKTRRGQNFNFIRIGVIHSPTHWNTDARFWPWGGTPQNPDLDRFNPEFFQGLDRVITEMKENGMNAELIVLTFYQRPFTNTALWTAKCERNWLRYITARYSAFSNIFLWTISNEYETHPDGSYRLDIPDDVEWVKKTAGFIKQHDPYRHLVTVHPVISASTHGKSPRDPFDPPWRIGEFYGECSEIDVISQQTGQDGKWDEVLQCWTGDAPYLVDSLLSDRRFQKPVINTENGYEFLRDYPTYNEQVHHTDKVRRSAWRIACAGGYFSAGFAGTLGQSDFWVQINKGMQYPFIIKDEGAPLQLSILYNFFVKLPFWKMKPFDGIKGEAVAIADAGKTYVIYALKDGEIAIDLTQAKGDLKVSWFNPKTGELKENSSIEGGKIHKINVEGDWVIFIQN